MQEESFFGKYRILKQLSKNEDTIVYLTEHIKLQSNRIIKVISKSSPYVEYLYNEANLLKNLTHPCIPKIFDIEEDDIAYYIVEQYMSGEVLSSYFVNQSFHERQIVSYSVQLCDLVMYLHSLEQPIFHLDIKPENILIDNGTLRLIDFGSAILKQKVIKREYTFGTPGFAAPEQYQNGNIDERADIYGIGMLMYYMALGEKYLEVKGSNIDNVAKISKKLKRIINKCLQHNPSVRYATVEELSKKLSVMQNKKTLHAWKKEFKQYAIAGSQSHIGTTHMALLLCQHLQRNGERCVYVEKNKTNMVRKLIQRSNQIDYNKDLFYYKKIAILSRFDTIAEDFLKEHFTAIVYDYGVLHKENADIFLQEEAKVLMLGAKPWELDVSEEGLVYCLETDQIAYVFNFIDGKQFRNCIKNMSSKHCYRMPYEPNFSTDKSNILKPFFNDLLTIFEDVK